jgi:hypothetical protein
VQPTQAMVDLGQPRRATDREIRRSPACVKRAADATTADHSFTDPGAHDVTATATLASGTTVSSPPVHVNVLPPPLVSLVTKTMFPLLGQQTGFALSLSGQIPSNAPMTYCFVWQEGVAAECTDSSQTSHTYERAGVYDVSAFVEQNGSRFEAKPLRLRVYEVFLQPALSKTEMGKPLQFTATVVPDSLNSMIEYCFDWGDGTRNCVSHSSADHTFSSRGTYLNSVELLINNRSVATSTPVRVEIGWPVWQVAILWLGGFAGATGIGYGVYRVRKPPSREEHGQKPPVEVRVVPKLDELPKYRVAAPKPLHKCLVRIRWGLATTHRRITPAGTLVKRKGGAHA